MALESGDPRTFDPELWQRLTRLERWAAVRRYVIRIGRGYRDHPEYGEDETAASVARHSILMGVWVLGIVLAGFSSMVVPVILAFTPELAGVEPESINTTLCLVAGWSGAAVLLVLTALRARQVGRWFVERYPALVGRHFWRPLRESDRRP